MSTTKICSEEFSLKFNTLQELTNAYEAIINRSKEGFDKVSEKLNEHGIVYKALDNFGILVKAEDIPEEHREEFYALSAEFSAEKIFKECGAVKENFQSVLYSIKTRGNGDFFVLAKNSTEAEQAVIDTQTAYNYGYTHSREVVEIVIVAKEIPSQSTTLHTSGGRLIKA